MTSPQVALDRRVTTGSVKYHITAAGAGDDPIDIALAGRDPDGTVVSTVSAEIRPADLVAVADLVTTTLAGLVAVHGPQPARRPPGNRGARWTAEDDARLVERFRAGDGTTVLMAEFGRSRGGIQARLEHLGQLPEPGA
jgi:hypothetical protein